MWIEHWVNNIIISSAIKKKIQSEEIVQIIRGVSINGKITWLLKLFELRSFYHKHVQTINQLFDKRNQFIHYKWKKFPDQKEQKELNEILNKAEKAVKYLKNYEIKYFFYGKKKYTSFSIKGDELRFYI